MDDLNGMLRIAWFAKNFTFKSITWSLVIRGSARLVLVKIACAFSFASRSERSMALSSFLGDSSIFGEIVTNGICKRLSN